MINFYIHLMKIQKVLFFFILWGKNFILAFKEKYIIINFEEEKLYY